MSHQIVRTVRRASPAARWRRQRRHAGTIGVDGDGDWGPGEGGMARIRYFVVVIALLATGLHPSPAGAAQTSAQIPEAPSRAWNVEQLDKLLAADPSSDVVRIDD